MCRCTWHAKGAIGDGTVAAYQRSDLFDKRRNLMADWARFVDSPAAKGRVIPMHKAECDKLVRFKIPSWKFAYTGMTKPSRR